MGDESGAAGQIEQFCELADPYDRKAQGASDGKPIDVIPESERLFI